MKDTIVDTSPKRHSRREPAALTAFLAALILFSCASLPGGKQAYTEAEIHLKRGDGFFFNAMYGQAIAEYTNAIMADERMIEAYRSRGNAYLAQEEYNKALDDFAAAIKIDPSYAEAYLGRGVVFYRRGNYAEAIDDFDKVIALDPWNADARYYKAVSCEKIGRLREAVEAYKGYIHCTVTGEDSKVQEVREKIRQLESGPLL